MSEFCYGVVGCIDLQFVVEIEICFVCGVWVVYIFLLDVYMDKDLIQIFEGLCLFSFCVVFGV